MINSLLHENLKYQNNCSRFDIVEKEIEYVNVWFHYAFNSKMEEYKDELIIKVVEMNNLLKVYKYLN